jgi:hypothetical protein
VQRAALLGRGVTIEPARVVGIVDAIAQLAYGWSIVLDGLFTASRTRVSSLMGRAGIHTDELNEGSVRGVFACRDAARAVWPLPWAMARRSEDAPSSFNQPVMTF